jgi:hypothetical protein
MFPDLVFLKSFFFVRVQQKYSCTVVSLCIFLHWIFTDFVLPVLYHT